MTRAPKPLPVPTVQERQRAREAAAALRTALADWSTAGAQSTAHFDYSRPRRGETVSTWENLPGFSRVNGRYRHICLPGWQYTAAEVRAEMIPDLEALAERGVRPTEATGQGAGVR